MRTREVIITGVILALFLIASTSALYSEGDNQVSYGHSLRVMDINVPELAPGESGILKVKLRNSAAYSVTDIRSKITLPSNLQMINDVNEIRIAEIKPDSSQEIEYRIIALPTSAEGIYSSSLFIDYVSHHGVNAFNVGEGNSDNYTFGIIIKSTPSLFVQLDNVDVYREKLTGEITLKFVNNGTSDIKFLTINLKDSSDYEIISEKQYYVGDLDSDDFQSVTFNIKVNKNLKSIILPIVMNYRDSMNNFYSKESDLELKIRPGSELGKTQSTSASTILLVIVILGIIGYVVYKRFFVKKKKY